jgi:DNA-binding NarL/FixJ family response regulator
VTARLNVLLVDDHAVVRAGFRMLLSQSPRIGVIHEAECGEQACQLYAEQGADVVIMDLGLPGIGGLAAIRRIRSRNATARILAFSVHDQPVYVLRALEAGASGYVGKSAAPDILLDAVIHVARGERYIAPEIARLMGTYGRSVEAPPNALDALSAREFDVFLELARGHTTRDIAEKLRLGYKTVANYSTQIKLKLGAQTSADLARLAYQYEVLKS